MTMTSLAAALSNCCYCRGHGGIVDREGENQRAMCVTFATIFFNSAESQEELFFLFFFRSLFPLIPKSCTDERSSWSDP